jgi:hypothetical protein
LTKNLNGKELTTYDSCSFFARFLSPNKPTKEEQRKMEEMERRDENEERGKEGFALFLPHETLAKVFAIIDAMIQRRFRAWNF